MRPIQDDYLSFGSIESVGIFGYLKSIWSFHGGNIIQFTIHSVMSLPSTTQPLFLNLTLFFLMTQVMVAIASKLLFSWIFEENRLNLSILFWLPFLVVFSFEGIFAPGFVGTYGFTLASLAHLWPILCLILALRLLMSQNSWKFLVVPLGLVVGNSNLVESAFACLIAALLTLGVAKYPAIATTLGFRKSIWVYLFTFIVYFSSLVIAIAPGFKNRSINAVGLPENLLDFFIRFSKSLVIFSADVLTHPFVYLAFFFGVWISRSRIILVDSIFRFKTGLMCFLSVSFFSLLVLGSTMAYPAWHQSMGLYVFLVPTLVMLGILLGAKNSSYVNINVFKFVIVLNLLVCISLYVRVVDTAINRKGIWDKAYAANICALQKDSSADLEGAEIIYPPFGLGVEDVNSWEWIRNDYSKWVLNPRFDSKVSCKTD